MGVGQQPDGVVRTIVRGYKTELAPSDSQRQLFLKSCGVSRYAFNWGLRIQQEAFEATGRYIPYSVLHKELVVAKRTGLTWMYEVPKCVPQEALRDLTRALARFNNGRSSCPVLRTKKRRPRAFRITNDRIKVQDKRIRLSKIGFVKLKEKNYLPNRGPSILAATVSQRAGRWFISLQVKMEITVPSNNGPAIGVDLGVRSLATLSDGTFVANPRPLARYERKLRRLHRVLARRKRGSNNYSDCRRRLARTYLRITNIRTDTLHKATTKLARTKSVIGVEDLPIRNMLKNRALAKHVHEAGFGEFVRQLRYKTTWYGSAVIVVSRVFPSTKMCSRCGKVKSSMGLGERSYRCGSCGLMIDRDLNAAINIRNVAAGSADTRNAQLTGEVHAILQVPLDEAGTKRQPILPADGEQMYLRVNPGGQDGGQ